ncbi:MAG: hypothetical protein U0350_39985 [Caldilineaceae bacterium]
MAQTTIAIPKGNYKLEVSINGGTTWTNISGNATTVKVSGGDQIVGDQNTADGSAPVVIGSGKTKPFKLECNILYSEGGSEPFQIVWNRFTQIGANKTIALRYSPAGGTTGQNRYTTCNDVGTIINVPIESAQPPDVDAGSGDPAMVSFSVSSPKLFQDTAP